MDLRVMVLALLLGVAWCGTPPFASLPESLTKKEEFLRSPTHFAFNPGLMGVVTKQDWDRAPPFLEPPIIEIDNFMGSNETITITGKKMMTIKNKAINAFQGIRYGKEPTADLRFKKTEPAEPYFGENNTLDATHLGDMCPQKALLGDFPAGREDCLYLNVYTPVLPEELPDGKSLPVMMFIHGGSFISGDSSPYLPTRLLDFDVILVVIHYRLGSLGFFSLQNDDAPGNAGLWDQIEALNWIQRNIEGFGGNRSQVTIFGEGAGSVSVNYLLFLPAAKDLFHGVIGESGSALEDWALDPDSVTSAQRVAEENGCNTTGVDSIYECMKNMPHGNISMALRHLVDEDRNNGEGGFRGAAPIIQNEEVSEPLVTKHPTEYYEDGDVSDVPLMIGANKHEGSFSLGVMYWSYLLPKHYINDSDYLKNDLMADVLKSFGVDDPTDGLSESMKDDYIGGRNLADFPTASPGLIDLSGVLFVKAGAWTTAKLHAKYTNASTFFYSFDFASNDTMFKWYFPKYKDAPFKSGVTHGDELIYLFPFPSYFDEKQLDIKERLVTLWTNFATYGNPTPNDSRVSWESLKIPKWEPLTTNVHNYMLIQGECSLQKEYPQRWHICLEDDQEHKTTTAMYSSTTSTGGPSEDDYDKIKSQRMAFMVCMIIFIIAAVILGILSVYYFFKQR